MHNGVQFARELPIINNAYADSDKEKFEIIKIYNDYPSESSFVNAATSDESFIKVFDKNPMKIKNLFNVRSFPRSFLIDRDGVIRKISSPLSFDINQEAELLYNQ